MRVLVLAALVFGLGGCFDPQSQTGAGTDSAGTSTTSMDPGCPEGSAACPCYGNGTCDAGLECNSTVQLCIPTDCDPGSESCTCNDGACLAGLECEGGVCVTPSTTTDPTDPATTDPATTDPVTTDATTDPATTDVTTDVTTDPATTDPATTDPATTDPATSDTDPTGAGQECTDYCSAYMTSCIDYGTQYPDEATCLAACSVWALGADGDTAGDSTYCRLYHVGAAVGDPATHCVHAQEFPEDLCV